MTKGKTALAGVIAAASIGLPPASAEPLRLAQDAERYYVHCVNGSVSVEQWNEEQMKVRRGSNVCQLRSFTSSSSAQSWARSNFPSGRCSC